MSAAPTRAGRPFGSGSPGRSAAASRRSRGWLGERPGVVVIDADQVAREVLDPGEPALDGRRSRGSVPGCCAPTARSIGRRSGGMVFADPAALRDLEAIVHPAVRPRILAAIAAADAAGAVAVVIEAIKLVEGGLAAAVRRGLARHLRPDVQRDRLIGRGRPTPDADQRIAAQDGHRRTGPPGRDAGSSTRPAVPAETRRIVERALDASLDAGRVRKRRRAA